MKLTSSSGFLHPIKCWWTNLLEESTIELNDCWTVVWSHHNVQVHQQLFLLLFVHRGPDSLKKTEALVSFISLLVRTSQTARHRISDSGQQTHSTGISRTEISQESRQWRIKKTEILSEICGVSETGIKKWSYLPSQPSQCCSAHGTFGWQYRTHPVQSPLGPPSLQKWNRKSEKGPDHF